MAAHKKQSFLVSEHMQTIVEVLRTINSCGHKSSDPALLIGSGHMYAFTNRRSAANDDGLVSSRYGLKGTLGEALVIKESILSSFQAFSKRIG